MQISLCSDDHNDGNNNDDDDDDDDDDGDDDDGEDDSYSQMPLQVGQQMIQGARSSGSSEPFSSHDVSRKSSLRA